MRREIDEDEDRIDQEDDRPRRKKKKKRQSETNQKWIPYLIIGAGAFCVLMLLIGVVIVGVVVARSPSNKLTTPTAYENYDCPEDVFHVDLPKDWKIEGGGKKNVYFVTAKRGSAEITVNENLVGSLIGDIAGAATPDMNASDDRLPVSRVHEFKRKVFEEEYGKYQEDEAVTIRNGFGKTRRSGFTGTLGGLRKMRGYRSTSLGAMTQITAVCRCSAGDWDIVEPAFARVIESLGSGSKGGR
jgi:hypothetical protein